MKILLLTRFDYSGASSRYRTLQYLDYLKDQGVQITVNSLFDNDYVTKIFSGKKRSFFYLLKRYIKRLYVLISQKNKFDLCWIEGELFPYLPYFLEKCLLPKRYVAEYDDAIFHNYNLHKRKLIRMLLGKKIDKIMQHSQHVVVGNEYVKQYALSIGASKVTILPTVVDSTTYKPDDSPKKMDDNVIIGWLGSPTTVKYIAIIESVLASLAKKAKVKLCIIGGEHQIEGIEMICHHWPDKWSENEEIAYLNQIDIGIMPLLDSPWEKGKCGFKLIKYMACEKPVIASPVSANQDIVAHETNGYLADSLEEWENYLLTLIADTAKRRQFGHAGRKMMVEKYSLQATAPIMFNILQNALN